MIKRTPAMVYKDFGIDEGQDIRNICICFTLEWIYRTWLYVKMIKYAANLYAYYKCTKSNVM